MRTRVSAILLGGWLSTATPVVAAPPLGAPTAGAAPRALATPAPRFVTTPAPTVEIQWRWDRRAFATGAVAFGVGYAAALIATTRDRDDDPRLAIPLLGPWLAVADREACARPARRCDDGAGAMAWLVGAGLLQAIGAFIVIDAGLFPIRVERTLAVAGRAVRIAPVAMGPGGRGLAVSGGL